MPLEITVFFLLQNMHATCTEEQETFEHYRENKVRKSSFTQGEMPEWELSGGHVNEQAIELHL